MLDDLWIKCARPQVCDQGETFELATSPKQRRTDALEIPWKSTAGLGHSPQSRTAHSRGTNNMTEELPPADPPQQEEEHLTAWMAAMDPVLLASVQSAKDHRFVLKLERDCLRCLAGDFG